MDYTTFNTKFFYIKKDSTYPELKYPLTQQLRELYGITDEMFENVAVTFSMIDADNGVYRIANVGADLIINNDVDKYPNEERYTLVYRFKSKETSKSGSYYGEFKINFLDSDTCITIPNNRYINITILDSITKTTVI